MSDQGSTSRPRNSDGTVNWTVVFDDPDRGVLAGIAKATSTAHLAGLVGQIGPLLFQRKNDAKALAAFTTKMDAIVSGADELGFDATRDRFCNAMVAEKDHRIEEAKKYTANKRASQSIERRKNDWGVGLKKAFFGTPVRLFSTVGIILIMISVGTLSQIDFSAPTPDAETKADKEKVEEQKTTELAPTPPRKTFFMQKEVLYPVFMMRPIIVSQSGSRRSLVPILVAPDIEEGSLICRIAPQFAESALFRTTEVTSDSSKLSTKDLVSIASYLRKDTNAILKDNLIQAVYLVDAQKLDGQALKAAYRGCGMHNLKIKPEELYGG